MAPQCKVFISHTTQDKRDLKLAHGLAEGLRSLRAEVWIAPDRIPPGATWEPEIVNGILNECTHFLVILSAASTTSEWVLREIELAQQRYRQDQTITILPLVVGKESNYPYKNFLAQFQTLPYRDDIFAQLREVALALQLPAIEWVHYLQHIVDEFESLPLSPIAQDGISMDALEPVRLIKMMPGEKYPDVYRIQEVVNDNKRFMVVGPSGSGKTTALRWVTYKAAKQRLNINTSVEGDSESPIPVFVSLILYEDSLLKLIENSLEVRGLTFDAIPLKAWISQHPVAGQFMHVGASGRRNQQ
jgi:hypothetical protein